MVLKTINLNFLRNKHQGKVRDFYKLHSQRILITTDRISAFDKVLGYIPHKGQVLNQLSQFWFDTTKDIVDNHQIEVIHPNVMVCVEAKPYPVEMVVRGYISGVTTTSLWHSYEKGERLIYGIKFPDGLKKNQKLQKPVITPTTKAEKGNHDAKLTEEEILDKKLISQKVWKKMKEASLALFKRGEKICRRAGIILVDTKYEFADYKGKLMLIDEIHTPDSSRFWRVNSYLTRFKKGLEPQNFDKEFFRIWYAKKGYLGDGSPPKMSRDLMLKTSKRYIRIYEIITGHKFVRQKYPLDNNISKAIKNYLRRA